MKLGMRVDAWVVTEDQRTDGGKQIDGVHSHADNPLVVCTSPSKNTVTIQHIAHLTAKLPVLVKEIVADMYNRLTNFFQIPIHGASYS